LALAACNCPGRVISLSANVTLAPTDHLRPLTSPFVFNVHARRRRTPVQPNEGHHMVHELRDVSPNLVQDMRTM
jgi:hypothetical protein